MDLLEAMEKRHSVRAYTDKELEKEVRGQLEEFIQQCNRESGLHMQLVVNEPKGFDSLMAHYGKFFRREKLHCRHRQKKPGP